MNHRSVVLAGVLAGMSGLGTGVAANDAHADLSFATASAPAFEQAVLSGRPWADLAPDRVSPPGAAAPADGRLAPMGSTPPVKAAEEVAATRGGLMTATAVPEPDAPLLMLAGLAVVTMLLRRRVRRER